MKVSFKIIRVLVVVCLSLSLAFVPSFSNAQVPFGGPVLVAIPCNSGMMIFLGPPTPYPLMWLWGELPFLNFVPPHSGQYILGMAASVAMPCIFGIVPIGAGMPIIYHGGTF